MQLLESKNGREGLCQLLSCAIVFALLAWSGPGRAQDESNSPAGLAVYSDLNFIQQEGEFVGLQIAIVPDHEGQKILWRSAGPFISPAVLLDVVKTGDVLKVVVPDSDLYRGVWRLTLKSNVVYADGPNGKFVLKRIRLK